MGKRIRPWIILAEYLDKHGDVCYVESGFEYMSGVYAHIVADRLNRINDEIGNTHTVRYSVFHYRLAPTYTESETQ